MNTCYSAFVKVLAGDGYCGVPNGQYAPGSIIVREGNKNAFVIDRVPRVRSADGTVDGVLRLDVRMLDALGEPTGKTLHVPGSGFIDAAVLSLYDALAHDAQNVEVGPAIPSGLNMLLSSA